MLMLLANLEERNFVIVNSFGQYFEEAKTHDKFDGTEPIRISSEGSYGLNVD